MIDKIFNVGLVLLAVSLPFSIALASLVFFPLLALWLLGGRYTMGRWRPAWGKTEKAYAAFLAISVLSGLFGLNARHSFHEMYKKDLYFLILVLTAAVIQRREQAHRLVRWFLAGGLLSCFWGLTQYTVGVNQTDKHKGFLISIPEVMRGWPRPIIDHFSMINGRVAGTLGHPLTYAEALLFVLAFILSFVAYESRRRWWKWVPLAWMGGAALLISQSRGPWIAAACIALFLLSVHFRREIIFRYAILALPVLALWLVPSLRARVTSIADPIHQSNLERFHMWQAGWTVWKGHPWLGIGPGNIKPVSVGFQNETEKMGGGWGHLHNTYVNFAAERGTLGLAAWGLFIVTLLYEFAWGIRRSDPLSRDRAILWGCAGGVLGFLVSGMTETAYNTSIISMTFYFVTGIGLAVARRMESHPS